MRRKNHVDVLCFLISPWIGFLINILTNRSETRPFIYLIFFTLFGYSFSFSFDSADSVRYAKSFAYFDNDLSYNSLLGKYRDGELRDLYRLLLFYFTSFFSKNPKVLFALAGLIYGLFSLLIFNIFVKLKNDNNNYFTFILGLIFYTYISFSQINGFRFWTGGLFLFYSMYNVIMEDKILWLLGLSITPLFHYSFIPVIPIMIVFYVALKIFKRYFFINRLLYGLFIISFILSWFLNVNSIKIDSLISEDLLDGEVGNRLKYVNSTDVAELIDKRAESSLFLSIKEYFDALKKIYIFIFFVYFRNYLVKISLLDSYFGKLHSLTLFMVSFSFIAISFPSGGRFMNLSNLFFILLFLKFYNLLEFKIIKRFILLGGLVFSFDTLFVNVLTPFLLVDIKFWIYNIFWIVLSGLDFIIK